MQIPSDKMSQTNHSTDKKIRYAVVGLGEIAVDAILPAFRHAPNSELTALVSGSPEKLKELQAKYQVPRVYSYEQYEECLASGEVDAVFIALPNHLHRRYSDIAARAGIHVLCEKPMAIRTSECEEMIRAAAENRVRLMIAYRLHFEPANLQAIEAIRQGKIGEPLFYQATFGFKVDDPENIRVKPEAGGGPLLDIGVYCINASRYLFGEEPREVFAIASPSHDPKRQAVDETIATVMRFPSGRTAQFTISFGSTQINRFQVVGTEGELSVENSFEYEGERQLKVAREGKTREKRYQPVDQFAPELIYFSNCVLENRDPEPSGEEGLADIRVCEAIQRSIDTGAPVTLDPFYRTERPSGAQEFEIAA